MKFSRRQSLRALASAAIASQGMPQTASAAAPKIRLLVLDVGGTIIEDHGDVPDALQKAFARVGITVNADEIASMRGASKREVVQHFVGERSNVRGVGNDKLALSIYADFNAQVIEAYKTVPPIEGAEKAFQGMLASGYLLTASTGFGREIATSIFHRLGWEKYFKAVITSDDVAEGRPAPYMIFHAMEAARVHSVAEVMAVGDTPLDLQAGTNAGVRGVVGVLSGASKIEKLQPEPHTDILPSVADLPELLASKY